MSVVPVSRRALLRSAGLGAVLAMGTACAGSGGDRLTAGRTGATRPAARQRRFGAEWDRHARTFMAWPTQDIWGRQVHAVRKDIAGIARAIAGYESVVLLARPEHVQAAQRACGQSTEVVPIPVDDLWTRDTAPVFVEDQNTLAGVDFNFNGWGGKQPHENDHGIAKAVLSKYKIQRIQTPLVTEGGSLETDGQGTLLVTESSLVNANRNPGRSRDQIEQELKNLLGVTKVIWFHGVRGHDITDAHVDSLVRFIAPGVVILNRPAPGSPPDVWSRSSDQAKEVLQTATDARGRRLRIVELPEPDPDQTNATNNEFLASYVNFYIANGAVFVPRFGDRPADDRAQQILRDHLPGRRVVPLTIDTLASGGGGIHCATHDQPER